MVHRIILEAVPASDQRYDTAGDWSFNAGGDLVIRSTGLSIFNPETFLIAFHEVIEAILCQEHGITQAAVDSFDMSFEGDGEPGDAWNAPYREEHRQAMILEHLMANFLGLTKYGAIE